LSIAYPRYFNEGHRPSATSVFNNNNNTIYYLWFFTLRCEEPPALQLTVEEAGG